MLHVAMIVHIYVASFCSQCFICFFKHILQVCLYVSHICLQIFLSRCCLYFCNGFKCFKVFFRCFRCMFQVFHLPSHVCFVTVTSEYFKSRSGVASPSSPSAASPRCLLLLPTPAGHPIRRHGQGIPRVLPNQRRRWALAPSPLLDVGDV